MIEGGGGSSFASEAFDGLGVLGNVVGEEFQGDITAEASVFGLINHAHAAPTEFFEGVVMGDGTTKAGGDVGHERREFMSKVSGVQLGLKLGNGRGFVDGVGGAEYDTGLWLDRSSRRGKSFRITKL